MVQSSILGLYNGFIIVHGGRGFDYIWFQVQYCSSMGLSLFREVEVLIALLLFREVEVPQWAIASRQENINSACQGSV